MKISGTTGIDLSGLPINNSGNAEVEGLLTVGGNVGIGVTPSAWTGNTALQIGMIGIQNDIGINVGSFMNNAYYNSGVHKYIQSLTATRYSQYNGAHQWQTAPSGNAGNAITWTNVMTLDNSGNLLLTSGTGRLGYVTGAGGTVTQLTSKTTPITLNKPSGRIYTHNAALAAGASATFVVYNSLVVANDVIVPNGVFSTVDPTNYKIEVSRILDGYFLLKVTNISGGSLSESVAINYTLIKGAVA